MKISKATGTLGLMALVLASPFAMADETGWYSGLSYGQTSATIDDDRIIAQLLAQGITTTSITDYDSDNGFKVFAGYRMNRYLALEGGYHDLGEFGFAATTVPVGTFNGNITLRGVHLDLVGLIPIGDRLSVFGKVGVNYTEAKVLYSGTQAINVLTPEYEQKAANGKFGAGLQYAFNESLALRVEAERYRVDDAVGNKGDIDMYSVALVFGFGDNERAQEPRAVVSAPPPEPMPMPAPAPQASCSDLDSDGDGVNNCNDKCPNSQAGQAIGADGCPVQLTIDLKGVNFDFDRDTLRPDAVLILDEAVSILQRYPQLRVEVGGHTDSKGSDAYNQDLSQRRSRTVYDYLANHGIDASRLAGPNGFGESRPIAPNENADGSDNPNGRALNRRTELDVQN